MTQSQTSTQSGSRGGVVGTKAILTERQQKDEEFMTVRMSKKLLIGGAAGQAATVVEPMVSQQVGPSLPEPELQSAPVEMLPEPGGAYDA